MHTVNIPWMLKNILVFSLRVCILYRHMVFGYVLDSSTYKHACEKKLFAKTKFPLNVMVYGNSKEIFSLAQFSTSLVAFDQQSF